MIDLHGGLIPAARTTPCGNLVDMDAHRESLS
jgi:hypothetical protein